MQSIVSCSSCGNTISASMDRCPYCKVVLAQTTVAAPGRSPKLGKIIVTVLTLAAIYGFFAELSKKDDVPTPAFDPTHPETIDRVISSKSAHPASSFKNGVLTLEYSLDPWLLTAGTARSFFYSQAKNDIPLAFTSPAVSTFCERVTATFKDIRGYESQDRAAELCMTRNNAQRVNWPGFNTDNFARIADQFWLHPGFSK